MIQVLTYSGNESDFAGNDVVMNSLHDAQSLDEFSINIINLQDDITLLKLYEQFLNGNIDTDGCIRTLSSETGLLSL